MQPRAQGSDCLGAGLGFAEEIPKNSYAVSLRVSHRRYCTTWDGHPAALRLFAPASGRKTQEKQENTPRAALLSFFCSNTAWRRSPSSSSARCACTRAFLVLRASPAAKRTHLGRWEDLGISAFLAQWLGCSPSSAQFAKPQNPHKTSRKQATDLLTQGIFKPEGKRTYAGCLGPDLWLYLLGFGAQSGVTLHVFLQPEQKAFTALRQTPRI